VDSLGVPLGVQQSAWAECGRSRLLTSLARPGVGCSPLCLGQESDPCSSVWPGCRSLHWLVCAGGLVFGCLLQWSSFCLLLVVNSWLHWCLPQSVHHSAHLVARTDRCAHLRQFCLTCFTSCGIHRCGNRLSGRSLPVSGLHSRWSPSVHSSGQEFLQLTPSVVTPSSGGLLRSLQCGLRQSVTPVWTPSVGHSLCPSVHCPPASS